MYAPNSNGIIGDTVRAVSPQLAYRIGQEFKRKDQEGSAQHLLAHAILGAATSYATGNNITTGALSGAGSEAVAPALSGFLFNTKDPKELTQEQKDTIVSILNLATVTTAYTATDGNTTDAVNASEIGKVGVEWNKSKNSLHTSKAINNEKCRNGDAGACEVRTLGDILGEYADKYHDLTVYSVGLGAVSYTVIVNNRNGNI